MSNKVVRKRSRRHLKARAAPSQIDEAGGNRVVESESHGAFAERLRILGKRLGSLSALARASGVSDSTIHLWLRGSEPSREKLNALSKAARVSIGWLVSGEGTMSGHAEGYIPLKSPFWIEKERGYADSNFAVKSEWIETLPGSPKPGALILFRAVGAAMTPTIEDGDQVLISTADREKRDGIIYAVEALSLSERSRFEMAEMQQSSLPLLIRRLARQLDVEDDGYQLICDNPTFPPSVAKFQVFGRVVWYGRTL